jgi:hypothetical protein
VLWTLLNLGGRVFFFKVNLEVQEHWPSRPIGTFDALLVKPGLPIDMTLM